MSRGKILAIDDEPNIRHLVRNEFLLEGFEVVTAENGEEGLRAFGRERFDLVLLDIKLPGINGLEVLRNLKRKTPSVPVIMITAYGEIQTAVESMKLGARDYVTKPFKLSELLPLVRQAVRNGGEGDARSSCRGGLEGGNGPFVLCPSRAMNEVYRFIDKVAPTDKTVLIQGETGVGKDVLAYRLHLASSRRDGPFATVDCGLLSQSLAESELYGHCKGAFSGASDKKIGLVESSHGGTLFLNEIGNVDLETQKKLLQFLETRTIRRVGENREIRVDARLVLATNLNLREAMSDGTLRKDLFYRMDVLSVTAPPLCKRPEDIPPLVRYFLDRDRIPGGPVRIGPEALEILESYSWPGNVRELRSVVSKAMIFCDGEEIRPCHLPSDVAGEARREPLPRKTLEDVEKAHILSVLEQTGGNQSRAAEILGINRKTLYKKIHKYQLFA